MTAAPGIEERSVRRRELPRVVAEARLQRLDDEPGAELVDYLSVNEGR
ncbi:hypothetical protein LV779_22670 [Streptomyces thinghirensis]|nr:hypothetical protein [Streptomyces thinghirensis]